MSTDTSQKIRLLLNELAILNQPKQLDGKLIYELTTLKKIKQISTELYVIVDTILEQTESILSIPTVEKVASIESEKKSQEEIVPTTPIVSPAMEVVLPTPDIVEVETAELPITVDTITTNQQMSANNKDNSVELVDTNSIKEFMNFSHKYEFVNVLFGGDNLAFEKFLSQIITSSSKESALEIYKSNFESNSWRRKSDTAEDLKKVIQKYFLEKVQ